MLDFLINYGTFFFEVITLVIAILLTLMGIIALVSKGKLQPKEKIVIKKINDKYKEMREELHSKILSKDELKALKKKEKDTAKGDKKAKKTAKKRSRIFVLNFDGDIRAQAVDSLREEITAVLTVAKPKDEILVKITSPGGVVHGYGLAASQLQRIRDNNMRLTVAVDKVAASGGYMMAAVANHILAAPFAIIGSIGVVAQLPNFNKLLKKNNIDFEQITAGEYKRTLTLFGENTDKGRQKMREEVQEAHELFKDFISQHRSQVDINKIATGEHWYGTRAQELKLVDDLITSDEYLLKSSKDRDIYSIKYTIKKSIAEKLGFGIQSVISGVRPNYF